MTNEEMYSGKNIHAQNKTILKNAIPLSIPLCVSIEPSNLCNFKCVMCFHGNNELDPKAKPLKNMDMDVFNKILSDIKAWVGEAGKKIKLIKLYSLGEPLLNPHICDMVNMIKKSDVCEKIEITTNGSLLTYDTAKKLVDYGLDILRLSVYAVDADKMRQVTQSDVSPDKVYENLRYLKQYRDAVGRAFPRIYAKMLDTNNSGENARFKKVYGTVADEVGIDIVHEINLGEGNSAFERLYKKEAENVHEAALSTDTTDTSKRRPCRYPFSHLTIRNDGTVIMCCADWIKELQIGNVMEHSLHELWTSKSMYKIRCDMLATKGMKWETCRHCEIPFRDAPEDDVSEVSTDKLSYENEF